MEENKSKKRKIDPFEEVKDDPEFEEFLKVQRNIKKDKGKQIWSDDIVVKEKTQDKQEESIEKVEKEEKKKDKKKKIVKVAPKQIHEFTWKITGLPYKTKKGEIKQFFKPLKLASLRIPPKFKGFAYVSFENQKDYNQAYLKHRGFFQGHRIEFAKCKAKKKVNTEPEEPKWKNAVPAEEPIDESGRIFIRNLSYDTTREDLRELFSQYGELTELLLPIDMYTNKIKGFAFVTFLFPEHAVKAFTELDKTKFKGRLLHLIPSKSKPEIDKSLGFVDDGSSFKKKKEEEKKSTSSHSHNWNALFLGPNALADTMTERYNVSKSELLTQSNAHDSVAVRMALGETQIVTETRKFLLKNGVHLDSFSQPAAPRSKTVILVKNLPAQTLSTEIYSLFEKFGSVKQVILPPSGVTAIVEMNDSTEAYKAFRSLAYNNFKHYPLYLEWAPHNVFKDISEDANSDQDQNDNKEIDDNQNEKEKQNNKTEIEQHKNDENKNDDEEEESEPEEDTNLFIKNLNFETTEHSLRNHFSKFGQIHSVLIATKKTNKGLLSMGYGFVQFKHKRSAQKAMKEMQNSMLDEHAIQIKLSHRTTEQFSKTVNKEYERSSKQTGTKILVRNIPFEAKQNEVEQLFSVFGDLKSVRLPKKLVGTGTHRGFGFVDFVTKNDAKRAFTALCHSTHLYGRRLVLEWANETDDQMANNNNNNNSSATNNISNDDYHESQARSVAAKTAKKWNPNQGSTSKRLKKSDLISDLDSQQPKH